MAFTIALFRIVLRNVRAKIKTRNVHNEEKRPEPAVRLRGGCRSAAFALRTFIAPQQFHNKQGQLWGTKLPKATYIGTTALEDIAADPTHHIPCQSNDTLARIRSTLDVGRRYCGRQHMSKLRPVLVASQFCNSVQMQDFLCDTESNHRSKEQRGL